MDLDRTATELKEKKIPFCWATVVKAEGSAPRHVGAKMIVTAEETFGTVGGGAIEHQVVQDAREAIRRRRAECRSYPLGPMLGQCCGGEMELFIEPVIPPRPIFVFGAGHIAEALIPMLAELNFRVTLIDERPERLSLPCFSAVPERWDELPDDAIKKIPFDEATHLIVITHQHRHDEAIVRACLEKPFAYLGCIGSRTKWEKFKARYRAQGVPEASFARVTTPIGLDIGSETPFEIAVAIAAQLIQLHAKPEDFTKGVGHFLKSGPPPL